MTCISILLHMSPLLELRWLHYEWWLADIPTFLWLNPYCKMVCDLYIDLYYTAWPLKGNNLQWSNENSLFNRLQTTILDLLVSEKFFSVGYNPFYLPLSMFVYWSNRSPCRLPSSSVIVLCIFTGPRSLSIKSCSCTIIVCCLCLWFMGDLYKSQLFTLIALEAYCSIAVYTCWLKRTTTLKTEPGCSIIWGTREEFVCWWGIIQKNLYSCLRLMHEYSLLMIPPLLCFWCFSLKIPSLLWGKEERKQKGILPPKNALYFDPILLLCSHVKIYY